MILISFYKMSDIFSAYEDLIHSRSFYSWDFFMMTKNERISFINGLFQYFLDILLSEKYVTDVNAFRGFVITEDLFPQFIKLFDSILFDMREHYKNDLPTNLYTKINELWNATFYFNFYSQCLNDPPKNSYPSNDPTLHDRWVEREKKLKKILLLCQMEQILEIKNPPNSPNDIKLESSTEIDQENRKVSSDLNNKINMILKACQNTKMCAQH